MTSRGASCRGSGRSRREPAPRANPGSPTGREERRWFESRRSGVSLLRATYRTHRFRAHAHDTFAIGSNLRGLACCDERGSQVVHPGALGVVHPGEMHGGYSLSDEPWVYVAVYPTAAFLRDLLGQLGGERSGTPSFPRRIYPDRDLAELFARAHRACFESHDPLAGEAALLEFLAQLLERHSTTLGAPRRLQAAGRRVERAVEFIEANLSSTLSLAQIAESSHLSRFHFLRLFKRHTGLTPHAFLMQRRVERAKSLLRRGEPIASVAYYSGFADQAHLSRRFRQLVGVTPGEFVRGSRVG